MTRVRAANASLSLQRSARPTAEMARWRLWRIGTASRLWISHASHLLDSDDGLLLPMFRRGESQQDAARQLAQTRGLMVHVSVPHRVLDAHAVSIADMRRWGSLS